MQADMAILHEANANDWAEIGKDPAVKLAVCRELLHKYWDLSRLRTMKEG
jgi:hypothetical protein